MDSTSFFCRRSPNQARLAEDGSVAVGYESGSWHCGTGGGWAQRVFCGSTFAEAAVEPDYSRASCEACPPVGDFQYADDDPPPSTEALELPKTLLTPHKAPDAPSASPMAEALGFLVPRLAVVVAHALLELRAAEEYKLHHPRSSRMQSNPYTRRPEAEAVVARLDHVSTHAVASGDLRALGERHRINIGDWLKVLPGADSDLQRYLMIVLGGVLLFPTPTVNALAAQASFSQSCRLLAGEYETLLTFENVRGFEVPPIIAEGAALQPAQGPPPTPLLRMKPKFSPLAGAWLKRMALLVLLASLVLALVFFTLTEVSCVACRAAAY